MPIIPEGLRQEDCLELQYILDYEVSSQIGLVTE